MSTPTDWNDEYWLPLLQLYLKKPAGVKPLYSKQLVDLSLELHIPPQTLYAQMRCIRELSKPSIKRLWDTYACNRRKLAGAVRRQRRMQGFGNFDLFYDGVEMRETFETDFRPLAEEPRLMPIMLIMALDLYFRLTPNTMVVETPEVVELARTMNIEPQLLVSVMRQFLVCDPCIKRKNDGVGHLFDCCQTVWNRFAQTEPQQLAAHASLLREYFKGKRNPSKTRKRSSAKLKGTLRKSKRNPSE